MSILAMNGAATRGYVYLREWVWLDYPTEPDGRTMNPNPDYAGFRVRVLRNPTGGEVRHEQQNFKQFAAGELPEEDYLAAIAWRVSAWNALAGDADGGAVPIPAPGETDAPNAWEAFYAIPTDLAWWIVGQVRIAHLPKTIAPASVSITATNTPTPTDPDPAHRPASATPRVSD